jgi:hypothetical protein
MHDAGILVDLAEKVLAVDKLQRPAPEILEDDPARGELVFLPVCDEPDEVSLVVVAEIEKTLTNPAPSTRTRHRKLHLGKVQNTGVVEVRDELVREEGTDPPISEQRLISSTHGGARRQTLGQPIV